MSTAAVTPVTETPTAAPTTTPETSQPAQPSTQSQPQTDGLRQLRETYENLKKEFEPWQKLNLKPDQVTQYQGVYTKLHTEAASIGRELGYPDAEIAEALAEDPVRTLDFLRNQASQASENREQPGEQDLQDLVQQHIQQAIGPIQQRENLRMTNEANSLFERTVHGMAVEAFKSEGITDPAQIPPDEMSFLASATSEILKYDSAALQALKYEGKTAAIQKAFQEAKTYLDKYYLSRSQREQARVQPARPGVAPRQQENRRPSLDEIIDNPGVLGKQYA
jgi:hypothetical protein